MRNNKKSRPSPRGLLADQPGAGKGDKPRHTLNAEWQSNYDAINWGRAEDTHTQTITVKRHTI